MIRKWSLPFTVLKLCVQVTIVTCSYWIATALTVCGIETQISFYPYFSFLTVQQCLPFTVLKRFKRYIIQLATIEL